jgi:galactokinase
MRFETSPKFIHHKGNNMFKMKNQILAIFLIASSTFALAQMKPLVQLSDTAIYQQAQQRQLEQQREQQRQQQEQQRQQQIEQERQRVQLQMQQLQQRQLEQQQMLQRMQNK